jgi:hypothetical protein
MRKSLGLAVLFFGLCAFVTRADEKAKSVVTLAAPVNVIDETAAKPILVIVTRSGDLSTALKVDLEVKGSAKAGHDYQEIPRSVTLPAGETATTLVVTALSNFDPAPSPHCHRGAEAQPALPERPDGQCDGEDQCRECARIVRRNPSTHRRCTRVDRVWHGGLAPRA